MIFLLLNTKQDVFAKKKPLMDWETNDGTAVSLACVRYVTDHSCTVNTCNIMT